MRILSILILILLSACRTVPQGPVPMAVRDETIPLEQIAFGACSRQMHEAPILNTIVSANPDLFLIIGDVIYPDLNDDAAGYIKPWPNESSLERIEKVYMQMAAKPEYQNIKKNIPMLAVWDDHDYGINDGSGNFTLKSSTKDLFLDFFDEPAGSLRRETPGIYEVKTFGPEGKRVQIILLDTRYFRTPPLRDARSDAEKKALNIVGRYAPNEDPAATVLGETQWRWLEEQFRQPAELRLLVSSYPLVANELGRDAWGNFPLERQRLFDLIEKTKAAGVIILSGDAHFAEISRTGEGPYPLYDLTSSPLAAPAHGNEKLSNNFRISETYAEENYGLIKIDWHAQPSPVVTLKIVGLDGNSVIEHQVNLNELGWQKN